MQPNSSAPRAPYALEGTTFPFPAIAGMAGRAPLGGPRELALACLLVARIVRDATAADPWLAPDQLRQRASAAKHWLGSAAIPSTARTALSRLSEAAANGDSAALKSALDTVIAITASHLDPGARLELGRLAQAIAE